MKSILIEDILELASNKEQIEFKLDSRTKVQGWAVAKPLNYDREYVDDATREAWIEEIRAGRAVAVHFTRDEVEAGEVPTLYRRDVEKKKSELVGNETNNGEEIHQEASTNPSNSN